MDNAELRGVLELLKEFKVSSFESGDVKISFSEVSFMKNISLDEEKNEIDPDELILRQIEEMKQKAMVGLQG